jgi:SAM-dependent methyltransferase
MNAYADRLRDTEPDDPHFRRFEQCFFRGASFQDVYVESAHGYAARDRKGLDDPAERERIGRQARGEFDRVHDHLRNLVLPLDREFGLAGRRALEFGCGTGALAIPLALRCAHLTAVDPTDVSLQACQARADYFGVPADAARFLLVDPAPGLPFPDHSFDLVITNSVLEFIPRRRADYVRELVRVLAPGGVLVVSTENGWFPRDYYTKMWWPRLRRRACLDGNMPYGLTWPELRGWVREADPALRDLSPQNRFNSLDKLALRWRDRAPIFADGLSALNRAVKRVCRWLRLPSDVFLPYATYLFVRDRQAG